MWWVTSWDELVSRNLCIYVQLPRCVARGRFPQNSRSFPLEVAEPYGEFKLRYRVPESRVRFSAPVVPTAHSRPLSAHRYARASRLGHFSVILTQNQHIQAKPTGQKPHKRLDTACQNTRHIQQLLPDMKIHFSDKPMSPSDIEYAGRLTAQRILPVRALCTVHEMALPAIAGSYTREMMLRRTLRFHNLSLASWNNFNSP